MDRAHVDDICERKTRVLYDYLLYRCVAIKFQ